MQTLKLAHKAKKLSKQLRYILRGPASEQRAFEFKQLQRVYEQAYLLVQFYYLFLLYDFMNMSIILWRQKEVAATIEPLWPLFWVRWFDAKNVFSGVMCLAFLAGLLVLYFPGKRLARLLVFLAFLMLDALGNSFGKINHGQHALIAVAFVLIWLPQGSPPLHKHSFLYRQRYLAVFWAAQLAVGLFYSMSGFWKIGIGLQQLWAGQINTFHPYALANLIAFRLLQTNQNSVLGWFIINHPLLGWPMHLGAVYLEFFAIVAIFRPQVQRIWGLGIMLFHIGTWLLMEIPFTGNMFLVGLFLILSPFAPIQTTWREFFYQLPVLGELVYWLKYPALAKAKLTSRESRY